MHVMVMNIAFGLILSVVEGSHFFIRHPGNVVTNETMY